MKKELDVNKKPFLHGYFHTASFMSIAMNRVRFNQSDVNVSNLIWVYSDMCKKDFFSEIDNGYKKSITRKLPLNVEKNKDNFDVYFEKFNNIERDSCFFFNTLNKLNSFEYKLNSMKEVFKWSMAGAEISYSTLDAKKITLELCFFQ